MASSSTLIRRLVARLPTVGRTTGAQAVRYSLVSSGIVLFLAGSSVSARQHKGTDLDALKPLSLDRYREEKAAEPSFLALVKRFFSLAWVFFPAAFWAPYCLFLCGEEFQERNRRWWFRLLRTSLEAAGPVFIKWGQWSSTRYDLFPLPLCEELHQLTQNAPAHPEHVTRQILERNFGPEIHHVLKLEYGGVEEGRGGPLASGSIGQVYRAQLENVGEVVVKVQHPNLEKILRQDFALFFAFARQSDAVLTKLNLTSFRVSKMFHQFYRHMHDQLDFEKEAENLRKFNANFNHWPHISFPNPRCATREVLVESFETGASIYDYIKMKQKSTSINIDDRGIDGAVAPGDAAIDDVLLGGEVVNTDCERSCGGGVVAVVESQNSSGFSAGKMRGVSIAGAGTSSCGGSSGSSSWRRTKEQGAGFQSGSCSEERSRIGEERISEDAKTAGTHGAGSTTTKTEATGVAPSGDSSRSSRSAPMRKRERDLLRTPSPCEVDDSPRTPSFSSTCDWSPEQVLGACATPFAQTSSAGGTSSSKKPVFSPSWLLSNFLAPTANSLVMAEEAPPADNAKHSNVPALDSPAIQKLGSLGLLALLKMIICDNFIHADLHPGNILVRKSALRGGPFSRAKALLYNHLLGMGNYEEVPELVILDAGLSACIEPRKQEHVGGFFRSIANYNGKDLAESIVALSCDEDDGHGSKTRITDFIEDLERKSTVWRDIRFDPDRYESCRAGDVIKETLDCCRKHGVELHPTVLIASVSALTLEGWQRELDPSICVMDHIELILKRQEKWKAVTGGVPFRNLEQITHGVDFCGC